MLPTVDLNYLDTESDRERMRPIGHITMELAGQPSIRQFIGAPVEPGKVDLTDDAALDAWIARRVTTSHHLTSTCRMGPAGDEMAVVDQFGRVRGCEGLRVADASIMFDCTRPNINNTTIMIGERIADFVKSQS